MPSAFRPRAVSVVLGFLLSIPVCVSAEELPLWRALAEMKSAKRVDLTHAFDSQIPHWKGFPEMGRTVLFDYDKDGFRAEEICHVGQWGTHIDPPAHFHKGKRTVEDIPADEMLLPLVVIDVHDKVAKNPDYTLSMDDVRRWEKKHGAIPAGAFVAMRTDWSKRWPNSDKMRNAGPDGVTHYPGWSMETLKYLYETRKITASGHETSDTDPGIQAFKDDFSLESYILGLNHWQIEFLAALDQVPEAGAIVMVSWPKLKAGSGFPARVIAIVPSK
jgi:kynurenine formamidase